MNPKQVMESLRELKKNMEFIPTGFPSIDHDLYGGFLRKEVIVIGGATGFGKSFLAGQIILNIAQSGFKTAYFSLEISSEMVVSRMLGSLANIHPIAIMTGKPLSPYEEEQLNRAEGTLYGNSSFLSYFDQEYDLKEISTLIKSGGYECVVIDFIQNVIDVGDEYTRLSNIALQLQRLAKETNCCIIVLSQLSNSATHTKGEPSVAEYKGSGSIGMVCDLGFYLFKGDPDQGFDLKTSDNDLYLRLIKNRRGESGKGYKLDFTNPGGGIKEHAKT